MAKPSTLLFMPFWVRDYLATTRGLSLAQKGALTDLLFFSWDIGPLPQDSEGLARRLGVSSEEFFKVVVPLLETEFIQDAQGSYVCERLEIERRKSLKLRQQAHERAKAGGDATKKNWDTDREAMAARKAASNGKHPKPS